MHQLYFWRLHTAPGFEDKAEVMPRDFKDKLTPEEIDLIVQFLLKQQ